MSTANLDRLLAMLIAALALSGLATLLAGSPDDAWRFVLHDLLAGALAVTVAVKVGRSLPRAVRAHRWTRLAGALALSAAAVLSLGAGLLWVTGGRLVWVDLGVVTWTLLTLHAWLGLALVPLVALHLVRGRWRLLRPSLATPTRVTGRLRSRRSVLAGAALVSASVAFAAVANAVDGLNGGPRRFTGSRRLPDGAPPIATTFLGEPEPAIDFAAWRLKVDGRVSSPLSLDTTALRAIAAAELRAVLDCTAGWAVEATWVGVPLASVLDAAEIEGTATRVIVASVTGWKASLGLEDARRCLLAWATTAGPLPGTNGAPLRLVAPDHRGVEWVKWVSRIEVA
jgi:molybdopterin-dependent oxidoreductase-like protein protein